MLAPQIIQRKAKRTFPWGTLLVVMLILAGASITALYRYPGTVEASDKQVQAQAPAASTPAPVSLPESVRAGLPRSLPLVAVLPSQEQLWAGKLLLIDETHPIPQEAPAPNTLSIAAHGEGKIAVRSVSHVTDLEVIKALQGLFAKGRAAGMKDWLVWEGSRSNAQQLALQLQLAGQYAQTMPLDEAAARAAREVPAPGCSEHQLPYVVDIRLASGWNVLPSSEPLTASASGRLLLETAWQYGFIHRYGTKIASPYQDEAYHFRYVGLAHSTLMHALAMRLPEYLDFLHQAGTITYYEGEAPRYAMLCRPAQENVSFSVPEGCTWEASMDNTGYAVLAVTFPQEQAP